MIRTLLAKEFRLMKATCLVAVCINFGLFGLLTVALLYMPFEIVSTRSVRGVLDRFIIYCLCTISFSTILFGNAASYSIIEKTSGILSNLLAYGIPFRKIVLAKALFATAVTLANYAFWAGVGLLAAPWAGRAFMPPDFILRDVLVGGLVIPLVIFLIASVHLTLSFVFTQLAGLVNLGLLLLAVAMFMNVVAMLNRMNALGLGAFLGFVALVLLLLFAGYVILKQIDCEYVIAL
jgi:hypothetical protein